MARMELAEEVVPMGPPLMRWKWPGCSGGGHDSTIPLLAAAAPLAAKLLPNVLTRGWGFDADGLPDRRPLQRQRQDPAQPRPQRPCCAERGRSVQAFKVGPDYLDPQLLGAGERAGPAATSTACSAARSGWSALSTGGAARPTTAWWRG